jgi:hypothetical protein
MPPTPRRLVSIGGLSTKYSMYAKVQDHPSLLRDMSNQHIVQTDESIIRKHEMRLKIVEANKARDAELVSLRQDVAELKRLIKGLING